MEQKSITDRYDGGMSCSLDWTGKILGKAKFMLHYLIESENENTQEY
jgi:hypothetical protein